MQMTTIAIIGSTPRFARLGIVNIFKNQKTEKLTDIT